jgi:hypothetical protein
VSIEHVLASFVARYGPNSPLGELAAEAFVREVWAAEPWDYQEDALRAFSRGERRIAFRSCHGVGKTTLLAWLAIIMLLTRWPQKTAVTAPTKGQLEDALLAETKEWIARLPEQLRDLFNVTQHKIELKESTSSSFLTAKTARAESPEALQGVHSANVLLMADESSGVAEQVFEAAVGSMSGEGATTVLAGNPVRTSGFFFEAFHSMKDLWHCIHVTGAPGTQNPKDPHSYYSPNVTADYLHQVERTYGKDSNAWRVRALGEFPRTDSDTIIPFELIELAQMRDILIPPRLSEVWGLDVARFGDDKNALVRRNRLEVLPLLQTWEGVDLMITAGRVKREYDIAEFKPDLIMIDEIGLGAGVLDRLRELGLPVRGINVSERLPAAAEYYNLRTEQWYKGRGWLAALNRRLPTSCTCGCSGKENHAQQLAQELALTRYKIAESNGKLLAEPKVEMKKRGYRSPNLADAFLLTLAGDSATLLHGGTGSQQTSWSQPLRRKRSMV